MQKSNRIRRIPVPQVPVSSTPALLRSARGKRNTSRFWRRKSRGQSIVVIALSMIFLVSMVALAVDGGSMYTQRRAAQNATDSAAIAGTKLFLTYFEAALKNDPSPPDGSADQERQIRTTIEQYAAANGVAANTIQAYFVNAQKQIVSVQANGNVGNPCGTAGGLSPCQVGNNGEVPWNLGAIGVTVSGRAETGAYFVRILGWNTISATARATALVEITSSTSDITVLPLGLFTSTINIDNIQFGQVYTLINGDGSQGGGQWGWVDFNGNGGSATVSKAWLSCGFNPSVTQARWPIWCPSYTQANGWGPTQHYRSTINPNPADFHPEALPVMVRFLQYGYRAAGWWLAASSGTVNSACQVLYDHVYNTSTNTPDGLGAYLYFPVFDATYDNGNQGLAYHVRIIASFFLNKPTGNSKQSGQDISCRPQTLPTATPNPPTPTATPVGGGGGNVKWFILGKAMRFYDNTSSGQIGDIFHAFGRTVALDR